MADNSTHPIMDLLHSFDLRDLLLAFCMSMVVGLLLGALVYTLMTWVSRRRASASITRRPNRPPRSTTRSTTRSASPRSRPGFQRSSSGYDRRSNNSLASAAFSFHRHGSSPEQHDPLVRTSTFHPLLQVAPPARDAPAPLTPPLANTGPDSTPPSKPRPDSTPPSARKPRPDSTPPSASKPRPDSFWGNSSVRAPHTSPTPPPAYESVIRAYQETCT